MTKMTDMPTNYLPKCAYEIAHVQGDEIIHVHAHETIYYIYTHEDLHVPTHEISCDHAHEHVY